MDIRRTKQDPPPIDASQSMAETFGDLALMMLHEAPLSPAWGINFIANFFTGPIYREVGERFGLSRPDFVILLSLARMPGLVARDVCLATGLPKNSISRAVSELLNRKLIERETAVGDKRAKVLMLTRTGEDLLTQVLPLFVDRQAAMRKSLTPDEQVVFDRLLMKIVYAMPDWVNAD